MPVHINEFSVSNDDETKVGRTCSYSGSLGRTMLQVGEVGIGCKTRGGELDV